MRPVNAVTAKAPRGAAALAAVPGWWASRAREAGLPSEWCDWRRALPAPACGLPAAADASAGRVSGFALGEAYASGLSTENRRRFGRHYTPEPLARGLWEELDRSGIAIDAPVVDPASGAGALLLPRLERLARARRGADPRAALAAAATAFRGVDNDAHAVWLGNAILAAELLPFWARIPEAERQPLPAMLSWGDGLDVESASAGVVAMNPPFGRASLDPAQRVRWSRTLYGHANWYGVFLQAAVERVRPGGVVAAVLPASFLGGAYYQRLRAYLAVEAPLVRLRVIDDRAGVFAEVLQETCLAVFHKGAEPAGVACSTQRVNGHTRTASLGVARLAPEARGRPWLLPRSSSDRGLIRSAARLRHRITDYGWTASTGPLVWNRHKPQIDGDPVRDALPILWAADVGAGIVRRNPARDAQRWIRLRERDQFMRLSEPAVLVQRTTAPEQPRRLVAAALGRSELAEWGGAVVVENHVNVLRRADVDSELTPELLAALLNTATYDRLYRCMTGTVAVSAYELEALPLPAPDVVGDWAAWCLDEPERIIRLDDLAG
jgi:adenine-specific DNA-methyltransferase